MDNYSFDVATAKHDDMKGGGPYEVRWSRVTMHAASFRSWQQAAETAACMAVAVHGGMPVAVLARC